MEDLKNFFSYRAQILGQQSVSPGYSLFPISGKEKSQDYKGRKNAERKEEQNGSEMQEYNLNYKMRKNDMKRRKRILSPTEQKNTVS